MTMKKGSRHNWAYHTRFKERKVAPGRWKYNYVGYKRQKAHPGVPVGSKYHWTRYEHQYATKTRRGKYVLRGYGEKRLVNANVKR